MTRQHIEQTPVERHGELAVYNGALEEMKDTFEWSFNISTGKNQEERNWKTQEVTFLDFLTRLTDHKESKKKNGPCFMQGSLVKGVKQRTIPNVFDLNFVVLDIDSGQPMAELRQELINQDLFGLMYTTYSHGTTTTKIKKTEMIKKLHLDDGDEITTKHVKFYLTNHKRYDKRIVDTCEYIKEEHVEGGVMLFVEHDPMPKYRIVLPLAETFVLSKVTSGNEVAARELWKRKYVGIASRLGASYDRSCTDISRLFFWPTHAPGGEFAMEIVVGDFLDLNDVEEVDPKELERSNPFIEAGLDIDQVELETPWLRSFMKGKWKKFAAGDFFSSYYDERNRNGDKVTTQCPFDDSHSNAGDPEDQGFFCVDGDGEKSFVARCSHDSCAERTKLEYVDAAIVEFDITEEELEDFIPEGMEELELSTEVAAGEDQDQDEDEDDEDRIDPSTLEGDELLQYHVDRTRLGDVAQAEKTLKLMINMNLDPLKISVTLKDLAKNSGVLLADLRKTFNRIVQRANYEHEERKAEENNTVMYPVAGDFNEQIDACLAGIKKKNQPPKVFLTDTDIVHVGHTGDGQGIKREVMSRDAFKVFLQRCVHFYQQSDKGRTVKSVPFDVASHVFSMPRAELPIPYLKGIRKHPVLSVDGDLTVKHGFDKYTGIYLDTQGSKIFKVSDEPTEEELDDAYDLLFAYDGLFGDFPFKDDGDDESEDPDLIVGESTKAHVLALFLLPMIREIIDGPSPAFVVNKPMPGAGSGLFANVFNLVLNNEVCPTYAPPKGNRNSEEFEKLIVSKLLSDPDSPMFFDNVERIDNNSLASAITSGWWAGRQLGSSTQIKLPINHVWLFSGNNIDPSDELARRMIPINIMPDVARPELRTNFYHSDLVKWTREHRADLIWALSIFIKNWVAKGMPDGSKKFGSFENWARVTGGILEAAGVGGFLDNLSSWRSLSTSSNQDDNEVMEGLFKEIGLDKPFKSSELFDLIYDEPTGVLEYPVPIRGRDQHTLRTQFGKYLGSRKEKIYEVTGTTVRLRATGTASGGAILYSFLEVGGKEKRETIKSVQKAKMDARLAKNAEEEA
ncbi:MAG: hypothetical protein RIA09_15935 [Hoeflea sp.]|uniref:hypothetical protein n=1 Tax=Hoeflea sp. TaxID=1940281 RepID=UPI0032ED5D18